MSEAKSNVVYCPPSPDVLEHFVHEVCRGLGGDYADRDTERGFADFMKVVARTTANNLNRKQDNEFDSRIE